MSLTQEQLNELLQQTDISWERPYTLGGEEVIASRAMEEKDADELINRLHRGLHFERYASTTEFNAKGEALVRIRLKTAQVASFLDAKKEICQRLDLHMYTKVANEYFGRTFSFTYPGETRARVVPQIGVDWDFADRNNIIPRYGVSTVANDDCERLFIDQQSPALKNLIKRIHDEIKKQSDINKSKGKGELSVPETLAIVSKIVDETSTKNQKRYPRMNRNQIEGRVDADLKDYLEKRKKGLIRGRPADLNVTIEELMDEGLMVCRHKGMLAAIVVGVLAHDGILPEGSSRNYRTELHDDRLHITGAHAWAVYREKETGKMWVIDPRWEQVKEVDRATGKMSIFDPSTGKYKDADSENQGYGHGAVKQMVRRLDKKDKAIVKARFEISVSEAKTLEDLYKIVEKYASKHKIFGMSGIALSKSEKALMLENMKKISESAEKMAEIAEKSTSVLGGSCITRNYGIQHKFIELIKQQHLENKLIEDIAKAPDAKALANLIRNYEGVLVNSQKEELYRNENEKELYASAIENLIHNPPQDGNWTKFTSRYGLRERIIHLAEAHKKNLIKPQIFEPMPAPQPSPKEQIRSQSEQKSPIKQPSQQLAEEALKLINYMHYFELPLTKEDKRVEIVKPVLISLKDLVKEDNLSEKEAQERLIEIMEEMYIKANKMEGGVNAKSIAKKVFKKVLKRELPKEDVQKTIAREIAEAKNHQELHNVLKRHGEDLKGSDGNRIFSQDLNHILAILDFITQNRQSSFKDILNLMAQNHELSFKGNFEQLSVLFTGNYGLRHKFVELCNGLMLEPKPIIGNEELNTILSKKFGDIHSDYCSQDQKQGPLSWARSQVKSIGHAISNKGQKREEQMREIAAFFKYLNEAREMTPVEKGKLAHSYLCSVCDDIKREKNVIGIGKNILPSSLEKVCMGLITEIENSLKPNKISNLSADDRKNIAEKIDGIKKKINPYKLNLGKLAP